MICRSGRCGSGWPGRHGYLLFEQPENGDARSRQELVDGPTLARVLVETAARLKESPTFVKLEKQEQVADHPLREVFRTSSPTLLGGIGLRMENGGSYIYQTLAITYVTKLGVQSSIGPLAVAVGAMLGFFTIPLAGAFSDRYGRMRVYRIGAIVQLVLACAAWPLLSLGSAALTVVVIALSYGIGVNITLVTTFVTPDTRARDLTLLGDPVDDDTREIAARPTPLAASYRNTEKAPPVAV
jgi:hypothetical protein